MGALFANRGLDERQAGRKVLNQAMWRLREVQRHVIVRRRERQTPDKYLPDLRTLLPSYPVCTGRVDVGALHSSASNIREYAATLEQEAQILFLGEARVFEED